MTKISLKEKPIRKLTPRETKLWTLIEGGGCQLPSCSVLGDIDRFARHHWDFEGQKKEDPWLYPKKIHLLCNPECHAKAHEIASMIIFRLEIVSKIEKGYLIKQVANILNVELKDVGFVLMKELKRAKIIRERKGQCGLVMSEIRRIKNIKRYLEIHNPNLVGFKYFSG